MGETIGFIGLGSQGGPMAARIAKAGMPLFVWARRAEALTPFVEIGAKAAESIEELGKHCNHVSVCVVDDAGTIEVCDALIDAMASGSRIAIHSTILPATCKAIEAKAATRGIAVVDAPVSGGAPAAEAGTLTIMAAGDMAAFEASRPVFETFGSLIVHLGEVGAGQAAKIVNNTLLAANMAQAHHALASGEALGIDRKAMAELIKASSGRSFGFDVYARLPNPQAFAHGGKMLTKDVGLLGALSPDDLSAVALRTAALDFLDRVNSVE